MTYGHPQRGTDKMQIISQALTRLMESKPEASADDICDSLVQEMRDDEVLLNAVMETLVDSFNMIAQKVDKNEPLTEDERERWQEAIGVDLSPGHSLKALEDENAKLKKLLAEAMLNNAMLKDVASKKL
jgi:hypothetical protein